MNLYFDGCNGSGVEWDVLMLEMDWMVGWKSSGSWRVQSERQTDEIVNHLPSSVSIDYGLSMISEALGSGEVRLWKGEKGARVMRLRKTRLG